MNSDAHRMPSASELRSELEALERRRLNLAEERAGAIRVRNMAAERALADELASTYEAFRTVRAAVAAGGRLGRTSHRGSDAVTAIPEIVLDPVGVFVGEECELRSAAVTPTQSLVTAYHRWALRRGAEPMSPHAVTKRLQRPDLGVTTYRSHGRRFYRGVRIERAGDTSCRPSMPVRTMGTA